MITIERVGDSQASVSVDYQTSAISATAGVDYTESNGTASFLTGQTSTVVSVPVINNPAAEPPETFQITLQNPMPVQAPLYTPTVATITVRENPAERDDLRIDIEVQNRS